MRSPRHGALELTGIAAILLSGCGTPMQTCTIAYSITPTTVSADFPGTTATLICK